MSALVYSPLVIKDLKKGIEYCLSNGKRLYEDAVYLYDDKRYRTAVPLYILAYEEFGKAVWLDQRLLAGDEVTEEMFRTMTTTRSHTAKVIMDYEDAQKRLSSISDIEFEKTQLWARKTGQRFWTIDRKAAMAANELVMEILRKLNVVKQAFLYINRVKGEWYIQTKFSDKMLENFCKYLSYDVLKPYHSVQFHLFLHSLGVGERDRVTREIEEKILASPQRKRLNDIFTIFQTPSFHKIQHDAYLVIDACYNGYRNEKE